MSRLLPRAAKLVLISIVLQIGSVSPAHASRRLPVAAGMLAVLQAVAGQNVCSAYVYDRNGNRISRSNLTWGSGTWGSSIYGCFKWRASQ
jgi:hypothetical protein